MIRSSSLCTAYLAAAVVGWAGLATACSDAAPTVTAPTDVSLAKGGNAGGGGSGGTKDPSVTGTDPAYGYRHESGKRVRVLGTNFTAGSEASWERNGVVDPSITVHSTEFVSSSEVIATISIAGDAPLEFFDVAVVRPDKKKGIGTELFEVTQAMSIGSFGGFTDATGVNNRIEAVGHSSLGGVYHAFYWTEAAGMVNLGVGLAWKIDEAGTTIVGEQNDRAVMWSRTASGWQVSRLPETSSSVGSYTTAVASDPVTGTAIMIAGGEYHKSKGAKMPRARLWKRTAVGGWLQVELPMPPGVKDAPSRVGAVNELGHASGVIQLNNVWRQVFWDASGSSPIATIIGPGGVANSINSAGTLIAGSSNGRTAYWTRATVNDPWSGPAAVPGSCGWAVGVDDAGRIVARRCPLGMNRYASAVFLPPYTSDPILLGGFGGVGEHAAASSISRNGATIVGQASKIGARWHLQF